eukprot:5329943-Amphidinium_carterae.1
MSPVAPAKHAFQAHWVVRGDAAVRSWATRVASCQTVSDAATTEVVALSAFSFWQVEGSKYKFRLLSSKWH